MGLERRAGDASRASESLGTLALVFCDMGTNWRALSRGTCLRAYSDLLAGMWEGEVRGLV